MNKLLPFLERVLLVMLIIGFVLQLAGMAVPILITISLSGLGAVFFLSTYRPLDIQPSADEEMGFNELLGLTIVPKVLWISTAIATTGILFYWLQLGNNGYLKMLYIGGSTIVTASIVMLILKAIGTKYLKAAIPIYYRAIPVLFIVAYILFG